MQPLNAAPIGMSVGMGGASPKSGYVMDMTTVVMELMNCRQPAQPKHVSRQSSTAAEPPTSVSRCPGTVTAELNVETELTRKTARPNNAAPMSFNVPTASVYPAL